MKYNYLIFDFDGTLFNSRKGIVSAIKYAISYLKLPALTQEQLTSFIGPPLVKSFKNNFNLSEKDSLLAIEKLREYYGEKGIFESMPYEGIFNLLEILHSKNKPLAIATAKPTFYTKQILEHHKWQHFFKIVRGSSLNGELYPKKRTITEAMVDMGVNNFDRVAMIGDTIYDIKGAQECGIESIAVNYGYGKTQDLKDAKPTHFAGSVEELYRILV